MIQTRDFKTKTKFIDIDRRICGEFWPVALDIGYSGVKGISPNMTYCFPSYAIKRQPGETMVGELNNEDILYQDCETGAEWRVGESAIETITSNSTNDANEALYGRERYFSDMFKVIARVGMGIGMMDNKYGSPVGKTPAIQTGLPPAYLKGDTSLLKEVLSGKHHFKIKLGKRPTWQEFQFELPEENIGIMAQPMGTLISISTKDGKTISEAKKYFNSNVLIFDPGFGTFDIFDIKNRVISNYYSFSDLSMKQILIDTCDEIYNTYKTEISVAAMQKYLKDGKIKVFDRNERRTQLVPFDSILEKASNNICDTALKKTMELFNNLIDHDYLIITGGTGAAWSDIIRKYFVGMETLEVISGNQNEDLPHIFSNVRGYYYYLVGKLRKSEVA